ncbi:MAG: recombinase RecT [Prevotella sp.]|nr:recombinase RecT [Prevotella sp.]
MSQIEISIKLLNELQPTEIVHNNKVRDKFIQIYEAMWTQSTGVSGEAAYEKEARNFNRLLSEKEDIRKKCNHFSLFTSFLDVAISGLTLDPGTKAQAYLLARSIAVDSYVDDHGQKKNRYETQCVLTVSGYGELVLRARCGQIRHADNPVIVYEEDGFEFGERNGQKFVNYTCRLPHQSGRIVACFMKITRADGSADYAVMLPEDWQRLSNYSARQNSKYNYQTKQWENGKPNALYSAQGGQIDPGFLVAKCIKHAFKTYPKARVGRATQLESQQIDETEINDDIYGITDNGEKVDPATGEIITDKPQEQSFAPAQNTSAGVTVDPAATDDDDTF